MFVAWLRGDKVSNYKWNRDQASIGFYSVMSTTASFGYLIIYSMIFSKTMPVQAEKGYKRGRPGSGR
jgi:hypothetical protein